jgi:hypothetical protein
MIFMTPPSKIQTKPRKKPTFKQKRFIAEYIKNNGNGTKAVLASYDVTDRLQAKSIAHTNLEKEVVKEGIKEALEKSKLTPEYVVTKLNESIDSSIGVKSKNADALKGIDMLLKLYNAYPQKQSVHQSMSLKYTMSSKNGNEAQSELQRLSDISASLLAELKSE